MLRMPLGNDVRASAKELAERRVKFMKKRGVPGWVEGYDLYERHYQGAIAEVYISQILPGWACEYNPKKMGADFTAYDFDIDVKCNRFLKITDKGIPFLRDFSVNRRQVNRFKDEYDFLLCTGINAHPDDADAFYLLGMIEIAEAAECRVETNYKAPMHVIPFRDLGFPNPFFMDLTVPHGTSDHQVE